MKVTYQKAHGQKYTFFDMEECCQKAGDSRMFSGPIVFDGEETGPAMAIWQIRENDLHHINHCPFCGEEIEVIEKSKDVQHATA